MSQKYMKKNDPEKREHGIKNISCGNASSKNRIIRTFCMLVQNGIT